MIYSMSLTIHPFFEPSSGSYSFIVANPESKCCAIIDAALGVDPVGNVVNTHTADLMLDWLHAHDFVVRWILETHVHADRPSACGYLKSHLLCAKTAIGAGTPNVSGYDQLLSDGDKLCLGHACGRVLSTPGHTPGCVSYQFDNAVFVGDTLFIPDAGTARCDFPGGCPHRLYKSIKKLLQLPDKTRLYVCHDYGVGGRRNRFVTTVAEEKAQNIHLCASSDEDDFAVLRTRRDKTLAMPRWQDIAIPANLRCMNLGGIQSLMARSADGAH
jgi:glyoxylase-like metal-dependent hydrolase (beta-lactamase superfamily II)